MTEAPFLLALHEDPDDEATWFALADWLALRRPDLQPPAGRWEDGRAR